MVNLSRFLIRPGVECQHLASRALGRTLRRLGRDFRRHYGDRPVLVETFVEAGRQPGVSLLAAGWTRVGLTAGRGRFSPPGASGPKRAIWCRPLVSNWRRVLGVRSPAVVPRGCAEGLDRTVWAAQEFGGAPLGDRRWSKRLVQSAAWMAQSPGASFPTVAGGEAAMIAGYYRMIEPPATSALTVENLLLPHTQRTLQRIAAQPSVLLIQDGTDLNFATHGAAEGWGRMGRNRRREGTLGVHLHSTMAVAGNGVPLGVMRREFAAPADREDPPKEGAPGQTQRWIRGLQASARAAQRVPQVPCIAVMDREGDRYPVCDQCRPLPPLELLVRAHHHRVRGQGGPRRFETLRPAPAQARTKIEVQRSSARRSARGPQGQPLRPARRADCTLRWPAGDD